METKPLVNNEKIGVWVGLVILAAGLLLALFPAVLSLDMMNAGYGLIFIGIFVGICGLITAIIYGRRARSMDQILSDNDMLARWTYDEIQAQGQIDSAYHQASQNNLETYKIMFAFFVVIVLAFLGVDYWNTGEISWLFLGLMLGVLLLLTVVAFSAPRLWRRQALSASRAAIISRKGVVLNGSLHTWSEPMYRLEGVTYDGSELAFTIRYPSRIGVVSNPTYVLNVPVPSNQRDAAERVVQALKQPV
jgi:hypothetical protein